MAPEATGEWDGIVVLGAPRSGTTLLRRLLQAHPELSCPAETYLLGACARFLREESFGDGLAVGVVPALGLAGIAEDQVLERLRELAFGFLRELAERDGKPRWAEKTAFDSFHIDEIERLCANRVRYLCIYRHGMDVACSIQELASRMERYVSELHAYVVRYPRPLEAFAHAWLDVTQRMQRLGEERPDQVVALRYEDLIERPREELASVFSQLGIPTDVETLVERAFRPGSDDEPGMGDWKTYGTTQLSSASIGRWRELSSDARHRLAEITNPVLESLGYPRVPAGRPRSRKEALRRMQLGLLAARMKADPSESSDTGEPSDD